MSEPLPAQNGYPQRIDYENNSEGVVDLCTFFRFCVGNALSKSPTSVHKND